MPQLPEGQATATTMQAVSNAMVRLHKDQFGRGPTNARSHLAGPDTLVCTLEASLLPAERAMVAMGEHQRVRDMRSFFQVATADRFISEVETILERKVRGFASAIDPAPELVWEIFAFEPSGRNGAGEK